MKENEDLKPGDLVRWKFDINNSMLDVRIVLKVYIEKGEKYLDLWSIEEQKKYYKHRITYFKEAT